MSTLATHAKELSTYVIGISFADESQTPVIPNDAVWTLMDAQGNIINEREDVEITSLDTTVQVLLQGDDLAILDDELDEGKRVLKISSHYNSDLGTDLPLIDEIVFYVDNLL